MPRKDNYKTKYLAALSGGQLSAGEVAENAALRIDSVEGTQFSAMRELDLLHQSLIDAGITALSACELLDETRDIGPLQFREVMHGIDSKVSRMPSRVIIRRVRDVLRLAEERIGILHAVCENQHTALGELASKMEILEIGNRKLQRSMLGSVIIGKNPSADDVEDYMTDPANFRRLSEYSALPDDYTALISNIRNSSSNQSYHDDSDSDSDTSNTHHSNTIAVRNNSKKPLKSASMDIPL